MRISNEKTVTEQHFHNNLFFCYEILNLGQYGAKRSYPYQENQKIKNFAETLTEGC